MGSAWQAQHVSTVSQPHSPVSQPGKQGPPLTPIWAWARIFSSLQWG